MHKSKFLYIIFVLLFLVSFFVPNDFKTIYLKKARAVGTTYYVKNGGNDSADGLSDANAWATISKVNGKVLAAGDSVLFKRGSSWNEQLTPISSGTDPNRITFGAYGTGVPPRLYKTTSAISISTNYLTFVNLDVGGFYVGPNKTGILIQYCLVRDSNYYGLYVEVGASATVYNCTITRMYNYGFNVDGTLILKNSIVTGNAKIYGAYKDSRVSATGNLTYDYNIIGDITVVAGGVATNGGHNQINAVPKFTSYANNNAYFSFTFDDNDTAYDIDVVAAVNPTVKMTFFINPGENATAPKKAIWAQLAAAGHEISNHTMDHDSVTATYAFTVTTTNANPTINVNTTSKTLVLNTTTGGNTVTLDWSVTPKKASDLTAAVSGKGWTITMKGLPGAVRNVDLKALADTGGDQAVFPYQCLLNQTAYLTYELTDGGTEIDTITGVTPTTFAFPEGINDETTKTWIKNNGFVGARLAGGALSDAYLTSYPVYASPLYSISFLGDGTEATIRARAKWLYNFAMTWGIAAQWYSHGDVNFTADQIGWFTDEIENSGGTWSTFQQMIDGIRADHSTADGMTFTKTYPDVSNYRLLQTSPAVNSGTDLSLTTDILGNPVSGTPDMGAYEYQPTTLTQVTPIPSPTNDPTPNYTFNSTAAGPITYSGDCTSGTPNASIGDNTITFNSLGEGVHNNCTIAVSNGGYLSDPLSVNNFTVDISPPTLQMCPNPLAPDGQNSWYITEPSITLLATDLISGVNAILFHWDSSGDQAYSSAFNAPEGTHTLYYSALDNAGNLISGSQEFKTNTNPPSFNNLPGGNAPINLSDGDLITDPIFNIQVAPSATSGIEKVEFFVDDNLICNITSANPSGVFSCLWDTNLYHSTVKIIAYDLAGMTTTITRTVIVANRLPETGINL